MKLRPILFSSPMVRAILDGRKSQTRRIVKPQPGCVKLDGTGYTAFTRKGCISLRGDWIDDPGATGLPHVAMFGGPYGDGERRYGEWVIPLAYGAVGDRLIPAMLINDYDCKYCADALGGIWSKASGDWKRLRSHTTAGYQKLTLRKDGSDVNRLVHKLVCEAWYGLAPFSRAVVRHLNGDRLDNSPDNLDWGNYTDNWDDRKHHGRGINEAHHNAKITMELAREMRASGKSAWALSKELSLAPKTVRRVLNGETWKENHEACPAHMPRWASRITLEITGVCIERLQDISPEDARAEGVEVPRCACDVCSKTSAICPGDGTAYIEGFADLWRSINGAKSWDANPFVWVIEFKRVPQGEFT